MPHFIFRLRGLGDTVEVEEVELPDPAAARREALQACGDLIREVDEVGDRSANWEMEVTDEDGRQVLVLCVTAEDFTDG